MIDDLWNVKYFHRIISKSFYSVRYQKQ
jgi:hypothetical protein